MNNKEINIALAINNQYVGQVSALIMSIHKNLKEGRFVRINILHSTVTEQHQDIMKNMVKDFDNISELNFIDMKQFTSNEYLDKYMYKSKDYNYISPETLYRLFIPDIFPQYDKILYLDSDMIVCDNLTDLYETDITKVYVAAIKVSNKFLEGEIIFNNKKLYIKDYIKNNLHIDPATYFNAGVLLLNLNKLRQDNIQEKMFQLVTGETIFRFLDQDILNISFYKNSKLIDNQYNFKCRDYTTTHKVTILHFAGKNKPWNYFKQDEFFEKYWDYFKLTPFYNKKEEQLYLKLTNWYKNKKFIKTREEKNHYKIRILFLHFTINKKYLNFFKKH